MLSRSRIRHLATASAFTVLLAACGAGRASPHDTRRSAAPASLSQACAAATERNGIVHCTELFSGATPIRLPSDASSTQRYGALKRGGERFYTLAGDMRLSATVTKQLRKGADSGSTAYANTIYLATIEDGTVTKIEAVMTIEENAVLRAAFAGRAMEGVIAARVGRDNYADPALPLRIEISGSPAHGKLTAKIVNATTAVRGSGGSCLAALNRDARNPLVKPYTADISIQRVPAMHDIFDDELVLAWSDSSSNMGAEYYPSIATLLGGDPLDKNWGTTVHAVPGIGPDASLHLVSGGGGAC